MSGLSTAVAVVGVLSCGLLAGVYLAFSAFLMRAFVGLPPRDGAAVMQAVNRTVLTPVFMGVFVGSAVAGAAAGVLAVLRWDEPGSAWLLTGGVLVVVGSFVVTAAGNVPLNDRLDAADPETVAGRATWVGYAPRWTRLNHVRTVASLGACAAFVVALVQR